jgi:MerR family transcriptional regulator, copper efflux regulator
MGLIYSVGRTTSNYRLFDESAVWCVDVIQTLRSVGFTLREIEQVADIYLRRPDVPVGPEMASRLEEIHQRIDERIRQLEQLRKRVEGFEKRFSEALAARGDLASKDPRRYQSTLSPATPNKRNRK